jgi:ABC-2 type transport system permease protein
MRNPRQHRRPSRPWSIVIRSLAFLRKELVEIFRQPRLLALMVAGPFVLLLMFGAGYSEQQLQLRTIFVGPAGSVYEEVLATYEEDLEELVESQGMVATEAEGRRALRDGAADVVVVFPEDPAGTVLAGEQATILVIHDQIDPIQQTAIQIAAQMAIQEVNATVLTSLATDARSSLAPAGDLAREAGQLAGRVADAYAQGAESNPESTADRQALDDRLDDLGDVLDGSITVLDRLGSGAGGDSAGLEQTRADVLSLRERVAAVDSSSADDVATLAADVQGLTGRLDDNVVLEPEVLIRPFTSETENALPEPVNPTEYFTPASLALLLQHLAITFAALSLVRDRRGGLFELMRVGPLSSSEILIGKSLAYLLLGACVAAALVSAAVFVLGVPFEGSVVWMAAMVGAVVLSSLALGMVLSMLSSNESQAVQFAMLSLLAGLFFGGFILGLEGLAYPVKVISWLLPVTYGIEAFQDVMLRGEAPNPAAVIGVAAITLGYGMIAIVALRRLLRTSEA